MVLGSICVRFFRVDDLARCHRLNPPCGLRPECSARRDTFPHLTDIQHSGFVHYLLQLEHGVHFVAAVSERYSDFFLAVLSGNISTVTTVARNRCGKFSGARSLEANLYMGILPACAVDGGYTSASRVRHSLPDVAPAARLLHR